jgi:hypothetical protein
MPCGGRGFFMPSAYHQFACVLHMLGDIFLGDPEILALLADTRAGHNQSPAVAHGADIAHHLRVGVRLHALDCSRYYIL